MRIRAALSHACNFKTEVLSQEGVRVRVFGCKGDGNRVRVKRT